MRLGEHVGMASTKNKNIKSKRYFQLLNLKLKILTKKEVSKEAERDVKGRGDRLHLEFWMHHLWKLAS